MQKLEEQKSFPDFIKETKEDISNTRSDLLISVLKKSNKESFKKILGIGGFAPEFRNREVANQVLEKTIFNPKFPEEKRQEIVNLTLYLTEGKELLEEALTNSTVKYLDIEFKKMEGRHINQFDKDKIVNGLKEISFPLKIKDVKNESSQLIDDLNLDKLVTRSPRESKDLKTSVLD